MTEPISIRVERPYASEDDFLEAEAWSVTARSLLLIDVGPIPEGTTVRCELRIRSGGALIVAEGIVVKHLEATPTRPAGRVVRYKRMSAASSEFIQRAVSRAGRERLASQPEAASAPEAASLAKPPPVKKPSSRPAAARGASAPPPKSKRSKTEPSEPPRRSDRPKSAPPSARPPASARRTSVAPRGMNPHGDPDAPAARSVSVVPPAKRTSTVPPKGSGAKEPPRRSFPAEPKASPPEMRRSNAPANAHSNAADASPAVSGLGKRHDSSAMQRLRSRTAKKAISTPPDREAILARLKKKPQTP